MYMCKRVFDVFAAVIGLSLTFWLIFAAWIIASLDTCANGFFFQQRVGRDGKLFSVVKIRTMRTDVTYFTQVTSADDPRITRIGAFFRRTKIDELPQLWNVLVGDMSMVGPRPDVPGYADRLEGVERSILLSVRPGITGPASLAYRKEEQLLAQQADPQRYNDDVIYPDKVRINVEYVQSWRFSNDIRYIWKTIFG
jgi:lipopolysaccharide/colanic/teichoic acid biosynthesis glycosyltransferase